MNRVQMAVAALAMLCVSTTALAQTTPTPAPDPERLQLARQIMAANGGVEATQAQLRNLFGTISTMVKSNVPPEAAAMSDSLLKYMVDEEMKAVPSMIDDTAVVYAEHMSVTELKDMLAWSMSSSSRSIRAKMPEITQELMMHQAPLMKRMMSGAMHKAVDRTCEESHCTMEQRQTLTAIVDKVAPPS